MAGLNLFLPENVHDALRIAKVEKKQEIEDMAVEAIADWLGFKRRGDLYIRIRGI